MKHALLAFLGLLLIGSASAQTDIRVSITYSAAAATRAGGAAALTTRITNLVNVANDHYTASGINIRLIPSVMTSPAKTAPTDTPNSDLRAAFTWAQQDVESVMWRCGASPTGCTTGGSMSIHITDNNASSPSPRVSTVLPTNGWTAVAVVPLNGIDEVDGALLEWSISRIIGSGAGYTTRMRTSAIDPYTLGQPLCYHTRETRVLMDPNTPIPALPYWQSNFLGTGDADVNATCQWVFNWYVSPNGPQGGHNGAVSWTVTNNNGRSAICQMLNSSGTGAGSDTMNYIGSTGSSPISAASCPESRVDLYSKAPPATRPGNPPNLPIGVAGLDSVSLMNARAATVAAFPSKNRDWLKRAQGLTWTGSVKQFIGIGF